MTSPAPCGRGAECLPRYNRRSETASSSAGRSIFSNRPREPVRNRRCRRLFALLVWLLVIRIAIPARLMAQNVPNGAHAAVRTHERFALPPVREVHVPRSRLADWLRSGEWAPIAADDYAALRKAALPPVERPPSSHVERASYEATLVDGALRSGSVRFEVVRTDSDASLCPIDPHSFVLSSLAWEDRPAVWGADGAGRTCVLVDRTQGKLLGRWSHAGRKLARGVVFDLAFPPAAASSLQIRVPTGFRVTASSADVRGPQPAPQPGWSLWHLDLGARSQTRLHVSADEDSPVAQVPLVLVHSDVNWDLREEGLRYVGLFELEAVTGQVTELEFDVPNELTVHRVTAGGDAQLPWSATPNGARQRLTVRLPEPQRGRLRSLLLEATTPVRLGESWSLPRVELSNGLFIEGRAAVRLDNPLEIQNLSARGFVQTGVSPGTEFEETIFRQDVGSAELSLTLGYPQLSLSSRVFSELTLVDDHWMSRSDVEWRAISASTFQVAADFPRDWDVLEVRMGSEPGKEIPLRWDVVRKDEGRRRLLIDFAEPLTSSARRNVSVVLRQLAPSSQGTLELPVLRPTGGTSLHAVVVPAETAGLPESSVAWASAGDSLHEFDSSPLLSELRKRTSLPSRVLFWTDAAGAGSIKLRDGARSVRAQSWVTADLATDPVRHTLTCRVDPADRPLDQLHVYLSGSLGSGDREWTLADRDEPADAVLLDSARHTEFGLPTEGELWEIRFAAPQAVAFGLKTAGTVPFSSPFLPVLAYVVEASQFTGGVEVVNGSQRRFEIQPRGLVPLTVPAANADRERIGLPPATVNRSWRYESTSDQLRISAGENETESAGTVRCLLRSQFGERSGADLHLARFRQSAGRATSSLSFQLPRPATLLSVRVDGVLFAARFDEASRAAVVPLGEERTWKDLVVEYSTPATDPGLWLARTVVVPQFPSETVEFRWEFALPREIRPQSVSSALALVVRPEPLSWRQRLFGPLGRGPGESVFDPLHPFRIEPLPAHCSAENEAIVARESGTRGLEALDDFRPGVDVPSDSVIYAAVAPALPVEVHLRASCMPLARTLGITALLVTVLVGLGLRRLELARRGNVAAVSLVVSLTLAFLLPEAVAVIAGGMFCGVLLAMIVPRTLVVATDSLAPRTGDVPPGSTATYYHPPSGVTLLLVLSLATPWCASAFAQPEPSRVTEPRPPDARPDAAPAVPAREAPLTDVLIPYDGERPDADELRRERPAVAYLPRDVSERWRAWKSAQGEPEPALTSLVSCDVTVSADDQVRAVVELRVAVFGAGDPVRLPLRLDDFAPSGVDACRVDDVSFPLQFDAAGGYSLMLPRPAEITSIEKTADAGTVPAAGTKRRNPLATVTEFRIVLTGHLRVRVDGATSERSAALVLPPLPGFCSEWTFPATHIPLEGAPQRSETLVNGTRTVHWATRISPLTVRWSAHAAKSPPRAEVELRLSRFVEVAPSVIDVHNRIVGKIVRGSLDDVSWPLPQGAIVQSVVGEQVLSWSVSATSPGQRRLFVEFAQPQSAEFRIEVVFLSPVKPGAPAAVEPWDVEPGNDAKQITRLVLRQMALAPRSGYRLSTALVESETFRSIPVDTFVRNASDWESARRAAFAWQLQESAPVPVSLSQLEPHKIVRATEDVLVTPRDVLFRWRGEVQTNESVAFRHSLQVDPRIQVESVAVVEDQANRLARWTRVGNRLLISLTARTSGTQDLTLVGRMPLPAASDVPIPLLRFEDAEVVDQRLILAADPSLNLELTEQSPLVPFIPVTENVEAPLSADGTAAPRVLGHYLVKGEGNVALRLARAADRPALEIVTRAEPSRDGLQWSAVAHLEELHGQARFARLIVRNAPPHTLKVHTTPPLESKLTETPDGVVVEFPGLAADADELQIDLSAVLPLRGGTDPALPSIESAARLKGHWHLAGRADVLLPPREQAVPVELNELPAWHPTSKAGHAPATVLFQIRSPEMRLQWRLAADQDAPRILAARTECVWSPGHTPFARTVWRITSRSGGTLLLDWPEGATLRTALAEGKAVSPVFEENARLVRLPLPSTSDSHVVVLDWTPPLRVLPWVGTLEFQPPRLHGRNPSDHILVFRSPFDKSLRIRSDEPALPRLARLSREASAWGIREDERAASRPASAAEVAEMIPLARNLIAEIERSRSSLSADDLIPATSALRILLDRLPRPPDEPVAPVPRPKAVFYSDAGETVPSNEIAMVLGSSNAEADVRVACFDRRLYTVPATLLAAGLLAVVAVWLLRTGAVRWVRTHRNVACLLVGLLWWFALLESVLGFVFLLAALAHILRGLLHRPRPREIHV